MATTGKKKTTGRKPTRRRGRASSWVDRHRLAVIIAVSAAIAIVAGVAIFSLPGYRGDSATWIYIPRNATVTSVADTLKSRLGSSMGNRVYMLWRAQVGNPVAAHGAYRVEPGMSAARISYRIARRRQTPVRVTFNSARTLDRVAQAVAERLECTPGQFLDACGKVLADSGFTREQMPAAFIPDTYEFYWTVEPERLVKRLLEARNAFWTPQRVAKAKAEGLTPVDAATIASIVDEETAKADEKPIIARLYLNRLHSGMKLQADPTVKFAVGDPALRRITGRHLSTPSPYNTYLHAGLPPGPIRIAEGSTIDALLHAPAVDYIYMCAKEDFSGYHNFTSSYSVHQENARRYQRRLNEKGIK